MSLVKSALVEEFKILAMKALEFRNEIATAKTYLKKEIFKKKLRENNIKAAEVLKAMQKVANAEDANKVAGAKDETLDAERRTETPTHESASLE
jgi:hypothetical protein